MGGEPQLTVTEERMLVIVALCWIESRYTNDIVKEMRAGQTQMAQAFKHLLTSKNIIYETVYSAQIAGFIVQKARSMSNERATLALFNEVTDKGVRWMERCIKARLDPSVVGKITRDDVLELVRLTLEKVW
ncbi:MAG: hypothetical protein HXY40_08490 [Chloroflexi bacterium]|nr:hypothetical protein [Chloroflexota bacterium]